MMEQFVNHNKKNSRRAVLDTIRTKGEIGRREIAALTDLSVSTVCRAADELMAESLIRETGSLRTQGAKRWTTLLGIDPDGGWVIAIDLAGTRIRAAAIDLLGNVRESIETPMDNVRGEEAVLPVILSTLDSLIPSANSSRPPLAIGISCPGVVDASVGIIRLSFNLELRDFPLANLVEEHSGLATIICHDVGAAALAEAKLGKGRESQNFGYVTVGMGIGSSIVLDGQVQRLSPNAEFGLMLVAPEGDPERFGGRGYLESISSARGIIAAAQREIKAGAVSLLADMSPDPSKITVQMISQAAEAGDDLSKNILARAANYLGIGLVNLAHTLGLQHFVIGGESWLESESFWKPLCESVDKHCYWPESVRVEKGLLRGEAGILGAGLFALDRAFESL